MSQNPSPQVTFFSRIGKLFKRNTAGQQEVIDPESDAGASPRTSLLRPWARRDQAIDNLQQGFHTLTDLMGTIRDNLEASARRQDELMQYLSALPQVLQTIPESNRVQGESLRAIQSQLERQNIHQEKLSQILDKVSDAGVAQRQALDGLRERVENLNETDQKIADNLNNVGAAMQSVSKNSHTSTEVLHQLRDNLSARDGQLERILQKQSSRFTTLLAIAIFLSVAALVAVTIMGYLLLQQRGQLP